MRTVLKKDEKILLITRQHWIKLALPFFAWILLSAILIWWLANGTAFIGFTATTGAGTVVVNLTITDSAGTTEANTPTTGNDQTTDGPTSQTTPPETETTNTTNTTDGDDTTIYEIQKGEAPEVPVQF